MKILKILTKLYYYGNMPIKICRNTIFSTLTNDLFDIYCLHKENKEIWESLNKKYVVEDASTKKFGIENYLHFQMIDNKDVQSQINEYHKLQKYLKNKDIKLQEEFIARYLIEKLRESWDNYKQQLKHK